MRGGAWRSLGRPLPGTTVSICGTLPRAFDLCPDSGEGPFSFLVYLLYLFSRGLGGQNASLRWSLHPLGQYCKLQPAAQIA